MGDERIRRGDPVAWLMGRGDAANGIPWRGELISRAL